MKEPSRLIVGENIFTVKKFSNKYSKSMKYHDNPKANIEY